LRAVGAPVITTVICVAFGLGIGGNYEGYRQKTTDGSKVLARVPQNANAYSSLLVPLQDVTIANTLKPYSSAKAAIQVSANEPVKFVEQPSQSVVIVAKQITPQQKTINKASAQLKKPVSSPEYRIALRRLAKLKTPEATVILETHMTQAKSDAASEQFSQANNGIRVLHLIAGVKSPVSQKAFAAIGDVIQQTIQGGPSEKSRQKLELLAALGNVKAHHELARWLESGNGLKERDLAAAYGHYVVARYKVPEAAKAVARIELSAPDMVKTRSTCKEGFRLLLAIAERPRNKETQYAVGRIYAQGLYGQLQDKKLAKEYLTRSARNGFSEAYVALKYFKLQG